jgi:tetratricopeptide (TPR) repeat protein
MSSTLFLDRSQRLFKYPKFEHLATEYALKMKEAECQTKLKAMKSMERSQIVGLVGDMRSIAQRHFHLEHHDLAETWWRRVVTCSLRIPGYQPSRILFACLQVINNVRCQGRISEATELHRGVHEKIMSLVGPEHELGIYSNDTLADLYSNIGDYTSEVAIYRQLLQICLVRFGVRNQLTLEMLLWLGWSLNSCGQYREAETLLCIRVELDCEFSDYVDGDFGVVQYGLTTMNTLAWSLNAQGRYEDSAKVLNMAEGQFKKLLHIGKRGCWLYYFEKARVLKGKGQFVESEELLRAILLNYASVGVYLNMLWNTMQLLTDLLTETNRRTEAIIWMEKIFLFSIQMYGIEDQECRDDCEQLGFGYAKEGRYIDAIHHFQQTIDRLALIHGGDSASRHAYTQELRGWISLVEKMREEAEVLEIQRLLEEPQNLTGIVLSL